MMIRKLFAFSFAVLCFSVLSAMDEAPALTEINAPGNPETPLRLPGFWLEPHPLGTVGYPFRIGTRPVSNREYCRFLNDRERSDSGAFHPGMRIRRTGKNGDYRYTLFNEKEGDAPVNYITRTNAARYCNYLTNGRGDTEKGAYEIADVTWRSTKKIRAPRGRRDLTSSNAPVVYYLPDISEWQKAAFYNPARKNYLVCHKPEDVADGRISAFGTVGQGRGLEWIETKWKGDRSCLIGAPRDSRDLLALTGYRVTERPEFEADAGSTFRIAATARFSIGNFLNENRNFFFVQGEKARLCIRMEKGAAVRVDCCIRDLYGRELKTFSIRTDPADQVRRFEFEIPQEDGFYELEVKPHLPEYASAVQRIPFAVCMEKMPDGQGAFGLAAHLWKWERLYTYDPVETTLKFLKLSGASVIRWDVGFSPEETTILRKVIAAGFTPLPIISHWGRFGAYTYGCQEYSKENTPKDISEKWARFHIPPEFRMFAENVYRLVRAVPECRTWEMANEPQFWRTVGEDYAQFLRAGYLAVRQANPAASVIMGDAGSIYEPMFRNRAFEYCDAIAVHLYGFMVSSPWWCPPGRFQLVKTALRKYGSRKLPFWITETNATTYSARHLVPVKTLRESERYQALHVPKALAGGIALGAEKVIYYNYRNVPTQYMESEFGIVDEDGRPKPAFAAFRTTCRLLGGAEYLGRVDLGLPEKEREKFQFFAFRENGIHILVGWRRDLYSTDTYNKPLAQIIGKPRMMKFKCSGGSAELFDLNGKKTELKTGADGCIVLPVNEFPVFLRGSFLLKTERSWMDAEEAAEIPQSKALVKILPPAGNERKAVEMQSGVIVPFSAGQSSGVRVRVYNHTRNVLNGRVFLWPHSGNWRVQPEAAAVSVPPEGMETVVFKVRASNDAVDDVKYYPLRAVLYSAAGEQLSFDAALIRLNGGIWSGENWYIQRKGFTLVPFSGGSGTTVKWGPGRFKWCEIFYKPRPVIASNAEMMNRTLLVEMKSGSRGIAAINWRFCDAKNEYFQCRFPVPEELSTRIKFPLDLKALAAHPENVVSWGGNKKIDYPLRFVGFSIEFRESAGVAGELILTNPVL